MKTFVILFLFSCAAALNDNEQWKAFKIQYEREYEDEAHEMKRFNIFQKNLRKIEEHNARYDKGEVTYAMKINRLADLTHEEFKRSLNNPYLGLNNIFKERHIATEIGYVLPKTVDWRKKGAVTEVKNQGGCGSCWAFSAVGALEGQLFLRNGTLVDLSPQNLIDCSSGKYGNSGCYGGLMHYAFDYVRDKGIVSEKDYPYKEDEHRCKQKQDGFKIRGYVSIPLADEGALEKAVAEVGPISCGLDASSLQHYGHGIIDSRSGCQNRTRTMNHAVLAVGYGEENGVKYWLVKNSWGRTWGDNGYFKLRKFDQNACSIATASLYPLV